MNAVSMKTLTLLLFTVVWLTGCGGGGGGGGGAVDEDYTFTQPLAGIVVSAGAEAGTARVDVVLRGDAVPTTVAVSEEAAASDAGFESAVTSLNRSSAYPFELLTLRGTGFRPSDSATSVIFRVDGIEPVVVPAIAGTTTTLDVAVPALINASGDNVAGHATVQVVQTGDWGASSTAVHDGIDINPLPLVEAGISAGAVFDAYLTSVLNVVAGMQAAPPGDQPPEFWTALDTLRTDLTELQTAVQEVVVNPSAMPSVASEGAGTVNLDADTLALADRLVASLLLRLGEVLEFESAESLPAGMVRAVPPYEACPTEVGSAWFDDFNCKNQRFRQDYSLQARRAVAIGAKVETSFYLSVFGGFSGNLLGVVSTKASTAFELVWSAVSGHIASWVTFSEPPTAGETLGEVGITVLEKMAGTHGLLSAGVTAATMGKEYDREIQSIRAGASQFSGTLSGTTYESWGGCQWRHSLSLTVSIAGFSGSGTMVDPYQGVVEINGTDGITLVSGSDCDGGDTLTVYGTGVVEGTSGKVEIATTASGGTGVLTFDMPYGVYDGSTISGAYIVDSDAFDDYIDGTITLHKQ